MTTATTAFMIQTDRHGFITNVNHISIIIFIINVMHHRTSQIERGASAVLSNSDCR